jgi:mannose/cellobiose epimerase-like protein (N-acyl-D-glucosamine 2-epimerase family)
MTSVRRVRAWAIETALPLWSTKGVDPRGGFVECLSLDGEALLSKPRRVRAQARQVYVYAHCFNVDWLPDAQLAVEQMEWLVERAWRPDGKPGWVHALDESGGAIDHKRDLYDHAFILLALATLYKATEDGKWVSLADQTIAVLDEEFVASNGGFIECIGGELPRRQNPHMHLFEAFLSLHAATGNREYLARVDAIYDLFDAHFFDRDVGILREYFQDSWQPWGTGAEDIWEPGHHSEWVWLLTRYFDVSKRSRQGDGQKLLDRALANGIIPKTGLLRGELGADNSCLPSMSRTWMQTEYVKALLTRVEYGESGAVQSVERAIDDMFRWHLDPAIPGGWVDHVDERGVLGSEDIPASTLYHLICCMTEIERVLGNPD